VRRGECRRAETRLGFREDPEGFALAVVVEPGLTREQAARAVIAPGPELGAGALNNERGVLVWLARRSGEQRLRCTPRPAGGVQRFGTLHCPTPLLPGGGRRDSQEEEEEEEAARRHRVRRTRKSARW